MRGHIQTIIDGEKYRVYAPAPRNTLTGRRRTPSVTVQGTHRDAERALTRLLSKIDKGNTGAAPVKFGELLDRWLTHAKARLAATTYRGYASKVETHIRPALGDLALRKLTPAVLDEFYDELRLAGNRRRHLSDTQRRDILTLAKKGSSARAISWKVGVNRKTVEKAIREQHQGPQLELSAQSVAHIHAIIRRALNYGVRNEWLDKNPAVNAEPPPVETNQHDLPPAADLVRILDELTVDMREFAMLAIVTGARRGELCGLRWSDVGEEDLKITRAVVDLPKNEIVVKSPKTRQIRRSALDEWTLGMLAARRAREAERALACGAPYPADAYIFGDLPGGTEPFKPKLATKRWGNAATRAGVKCRLHDLRHFHVTELIDAGYEVGDVSKGVGHARTSITQDLYQHARRSRGQSAAEHLSRLVRPAT